MFVESVPLEIDLGGISSNPLAPKRVVLIR
jgi:hypothetical protein